MKKVTTPTRPRASRPQYRVYSRSSDEESGEYWYSREYSFATSSEAEAYSEEARQYTGRAHVVRGPGEPAPKSGYMDERTQTAELRARFAEMGADEQAAYLGL